MARAMERDGGVKSVGVSAVVRCTQRHATGKDGGAVFSPFVFSGILSYPWAVECSFTSLLHLRSIVLTLALEVLLAVQNATQKIHVRLVERAVHNVLHIAQELL